MQNYFQQHSFNLVSNTLSRPDGFLDKKIEKSVKFFWREKKNLTTTQRKRKKKFLFERM